MCAKTFYRLWQIQRGSDAFLVTLHRLRIHFLKLNRTERSVIMAPLTKWPKNPDCCNCCPRENMPPTQLSQPKMTFHVTFGHTTCSAVMVHQPIALRTHGDTCLLSLLDSVSPSALLHQLPSATLTLIFCLLWLSCWSCTTNLLTGVSPILEWQSSNLAKYLKILCQIFFFDIQIMITLNDLKHTYAMCNGAEGSSEIEWKKYSINERVYSSLICPITTAKFLEWWRDCSDLCSFNVIFKMILLLWSS